MKTPVSKPKKPYPEFPLFAHATRRWAKKIRGRLHYFGPWDDPIAALDKYQRDRDDLHAGRTPRVATDETTVRDVVNEFLGAKKARVESGELTERSFGDYYATCERVLAVFGKHRLVSDLRADDFAKLRSRVAKTWGPVALGNEINRVRIIFKYALDAEIISRLPSFGPDFKRPTRTILRKARQQKGPRMLDATQLRKVIRAASQPLQTMILLGINCGFGNADVGTLPLTAIDLRRGWVNYPRPKTGIERRCRLWPETVQALRSVIAERPKTSDDNASGLVFVTRYGQAWHKRGELTEEGKIRGIDDPIAKETAKLLKRLKLHRPGLSFYALRHTFETIGGETRDQAAVDTIMGHAPHANDMSAVYRERMTDARLQAVSDYVRHWLFGKTRQRSAK